jgi:CRP-like cAMP-binding protein
LGKGLDRSEIGAEIGVSANRIQSRVDAMRRFGGIPITLHRLRSRSSWKTVERMWHAGATNAEIAIRIGSTPESVSEIVKSMREAGYDMPKGKPSQRKVAA